MRFATGYRRRRLAVFRAPGQHSDAPRNGGRRPARRGRGRRHVLDDDRRGNPGAETVDCTNRTAGVAYPLRVRGGHLVDARGRPFLINGDSAWSLIAQLRDDDVDRYLDDRKARGFNAVLVSLIEHTYASKAPADIYGTQPFRVDDDFTTPNEAY